MARHAGMGKTSERNPRTRSTPPADDLQTQLEVEMGSAGKAHAVPRERLIGPHQGRFETEQARTRRKNGDVDQPLGPGTDVAPTPLATARERERHRLERELGRTPAGEERQLRDRRKPGVTRQALREAQRQADRNVVGHEVPSRSR